MSEILNTIDELIKVQRLAHITDENFAKQFGYHRISWIRIKNGKIKRPIDFLSSVPSVYPELKKTVKADIEKILSQKVTKCNHNIPQNV
jgi:predicted transcriptional regulator